MEDDDQILPVSTQVARQRLTAVLQSHQEISAVLESAAEQLSGRNRSELLALSRWFARPLTADEVLLRPRGLAICLPLMSSSAQGPLQRLHIEDAVRRGIDRQYKHVPRSQRLVGALAYPAVLLLFCGLLMVALSLFLVPEFERMFADFGLQLPPATLLLIQLSHWIQTWGVIVTCILVALLIVIRLTIAFQGGSFLWLQKFRGMLRSSRSAWADWAWHIGLLIEAGVPQVDAMDVAGQASCKPWLQQSSGVMAQQLRNRVLGSAQIFPHFRGLPLHMLAYALQLPNPNLQAVLLQDIATMYWDRDRSRGHWWLACLSPVVASLIGIMVGTVVVGLFMPLVQLIRGLT